MLGLASAIDALLGRKSFKLLDLDSLESRLLECILMLSPSESTYEALLNSSMLIFDLLRFGESLLSVSLFIADCANLLFTDAEVNLVD